jgi:mono/diheme cytochrome c family protein
MMRSEGLRGRAALFVLLACVAAPAAHGEGESEAQRPKAGGPGAVLYLSYCESCHGVEGRGDGPAAASLRTPPADLTQLWARYGTPLDRERLAGYIDGRMLFSVHGSREMPIWGDEFFEGAPPETPGLEDAKRRLIDVLVEYLERFQSRRET